MKKNKIIIPTYMDKQNLYIVSAWEYFLALRKAEIDGVITFANCFNLVKDEYQNYLYNMKEQLQRWEEVYGGDWAITGQLTTQFRDLCENYKKEKHEKRTSRNHK